MPGKGGQLTLTRPWVSVVLSLSLVAYDINGDILSGQPTSTPALQQPESSLRTARALLRVNRPWHAWQLVSPLLVSRRSGDAVILAALSMACMGQWSEVESILSQSILHDSTAEGTAQMLLARGLLERGSDSLAMLHAEHAVRLAHGPVQAEPLITLARALERAGQRDNAAHRYIEAAQVAPLIHDWLLLRAAALTLDSGARAAIYISVNDSVARRRIGWTEAVAMERGSHLQSAARAYDAAGFPLAALRVGAMAARSETDRRAIIRRLLGMLDGQRGTAGSREIIGTFDQLFPDSSLSDQLALARAATRISWSARAVLGFRKVTSMGASLSPNDRLSLGLMLGRLGRRAEALVELGSIERDVGVGLAARFQQARLLLASDRNAARQKLQSIIRDAPGDSSSVAAMLLLADLAIDEHNDTLARHELLDIAIRFPSSAHTPKALFQAAIISYVLGMFRRAAVELDSLALLYPRSDETTAALYWSGRAWKEAHGPVEARRHWKAVQARDPISYYSVLAGRRLGSVPWTPRPSVDVFLRVPAAEIAILRAEMLERFGLHIEAELEYDLLASIARGSPAAQLTVMHLLGARDQSWRVLALLRTSPDDWPSSDARYYRLVYPEPFRDVVVESSRANHLDAELVFAVIRQESSFNPRATSTAGARGLMQVEPTVGRMLMTNTGTLPWNADLLYQPEVNVLLGARHLRHFQQRYVDRPHRLAAYNAGESRVSRWDQRLGASDSELFVERIPFAETRDYVRVVERNRAMYHILYGR